MKLRAREIAEKKGEKERKKRKNGSASSETKIGP
jgi:hypothetical protein